MTVAQSVLTPISSNGKNAHGVFLKLYLPSKTTVAKIVLTPISRTKKKELRTEFLTSFSFLTIRANLKQNNSCAV